MALFCWAFSLFICLVLVSVHAMKVLSCREKLQSSLGMTVNGMTGLLDSRSRAVRKHSMAASFFPWACKTSPRLFQAMWLVVWVRTASLRTFWASSLRPSLLSTRPCQQTSDEQLTTAQKKGRNGAPRAPTKLPCECRHRSPMEGASPPISEESKWSVVKFCVFW